MFARMVYLWLADRLGSTNQSNEQARFQLVVVISAHEVKINEEGQWVVVLPVKNVPFDVCLRLHVLSKLMTGWKFKNRKSA